MRHEDLIVVGGGLTGFAVAIDAAQVDAQRLAVALTDALKAAGARTLFGLAARRRRASSTPRATLYLRREQIIPPGGGDGLAGFGVCWSRDENEAQAALALICRAGGTPIADGIEAVDHVALLRSGDIDDPRVQGSYLKSGFVADRPGDLIDAIVDGFWGHPARAILLFFQQSGGAIGRVAPGATAFSRREEPRAWTLTPRHGRQNRLPGLLRTSAWGRYGPP